MKKWAMILSVLVLGVFLKTVFATRVYIVIDNAKLRKSIISIPAFLNSDDPELSKKIREVMIDDLTFSNIFDFVEPKQNLLTGIEPESVNFKEWASLGVEFLSTGTLKTKDNDLILDFRLYDIKSAKLVTGKQYISKRENLRTLAHQCSNDIVFELTGEKGIFLTKILFISDKTKHKELYVMDYDGKNIQQLTFHKSIVLSPAWAPDGKTIYYSRFTTHDNHIKNIDLFALDIYSGEERVISDKLGGNSGVSASPTGEEIIFTMNVDGNPELYLTNKVGENSRRLTQHEALDVEPFFSPDGKKIVFSSGRAPLAHLYVMKMDSKEISRLTFAGQFNSSPAWSPRGNKIVFAAQLQSQFDLFMLNPDGTGLERLTKAAQPREHNEYPSWSPDGRHLIFSSTRKGKSGLYLIREDGGGEQSLLTYYGNSSIPKWSPYLE